MPVTVRTLLLAIAAVLCLLAALGISSRVGLGWLGMMCVSIALAVP